MRPAQFALGEKNEITICPESISFARALSAAQSIDDLLRAVPSAATVSILKQLEQLTNFYDLDALTTRVQFSVNHQNLWTIDNTFRRTDDDELRTHEQNKAVVTAFSESATIVAACADQIAKVYRADTWASIMNGYMSGRHNHGNGLHFDWPESNPRSWVRVAIGGGEEAPGVPNAAARNIIGKSALAVMFGWPFDGPFSQKSLIHLASEGHGTTEVVPNHDAYQIIRRSPCAPILDWPFRDPSFENSMDNLFKTLFKLMPHESFRRLCTELNEALRPLQRDAVNMLHFLSFHKQGAITGNRVCLKTVTHFAPS